MAVPNAAYWKNRDHEWQKHYIEWADVAAGQMQAALEEAQEKLELALRRFDDEVRTHAAGRKATYADFNASLSADELYQHQQAFAALGADGTNTGPFRGMTWEKYQQWVPIVRSHLEAMEAQIEAWTGKLAANYQKVLQASFESMGELRDAFNWESLDKAVGYHLDFDRISPQQVAALAELGSGLMSSDFSERVWSNRYTLAQALRRTLPQRFLTGTPLPAMVAELRKMTQGSQYAAERILRTEGTAIATRADQRMYEQLGAGAYEFLATLDSRVDDLCVAMDGQTFNLDDLAIGTNAPPLHPHCRCTTVPAIPADEFTELGERAARDQDGKTIMVPDAMSFEEWRELYYPLPAGMDPRRGNEADVSARTGPRPIVDQCFATVETVLEAMGLNQELPGNIKYVITDSDAPDVIDYLKAQGVKIVKTANFAGSRAMDLLPRLSKPESYSVSVSTVNSAVRMRSPGGSSGNCASNAEALELRARGYNVTATVSVVGRTNESIASGWVDKDGVIRPFTMNTRGSKAQSFLSSVTNSWSDGDRGFVSFTRDRKYGGGSHIMSLEKNNGTITIYDGQSGGVVSVLRLGQAVPKTLGVLKVNDLTPTDTVALFVEDAGVAAADDASIFAMQEIGLSKRRSELLAANQALSNMDDWKRTATTIQGLNSDIIVLSKDRRGRYGSP